MKSVRTFSLVTTLLASLSLTPAMAVMQAEPSATSQSASPRIYTVDVKPGVSLEEVQESMKLRANALNLKLVAELPLSKQVEVMTGQPQRLTTIFQFCDALIAKQLVEQNENLAIYLPCRISLIEREDGKANLVMMDIDTDALAKNYNLKPELAAKMAQVRQQLIEIMQAGANGDI
jgi:uncharacterized protein (DUF302 family)